MKSIGCAVCSADRNEEGCRRNARQSYWLLVIIRFHFDLNFFIGIFRNSFHANVQGCALYRSLNLIPESRCLPIFYSINNLYWIQWNNLIVCLSAQHRWSLHTFGCEQIGVSPLRHSMATSLAGVSNEVMWYVWQFGEELRNSDLEVE